MSSSAFPGVETPGYFQMFLRNNYQWYRIKELTAFHFCFGGTLFVEVSPCKVVF
jgi:hypothetical protein